MDIENELNKLPNWFDQFPDETRQEWKDRTFWYHYGSDKVFKPVVDNPTGP